MSGNICAPIEEGRAAMQQFIDWFIANAPTWAMNLAMAALTLIVGAVVIKMISAAVRKASEKAGRKKLFASFIASVVSKSCWTVLAIMVLGRLGVNVAPLIAGLGVTGFIVGFACQESLSNLAAGLMIAINEPFKCGDFIEAAGHSGTVREVNMMATVMTTPDNKRIVLPNKGVWGGPIVNYSANDLRRVDLQIGIGYGSDIAKALATVEETVRALPGVIAEPAPAVGVAGLDASQITLNVRPWCANADYWTVYAAALPAIKSALDRAGIEIPFPQIVVHRAG